MVGTGTLGLRYFISEPSTPRSSEPAIPPPRPPIIALVASRTTTLVAVRAADLAIEVVRLSVRRVAGITLGTLLRTEIAGPLGADVYIGLPRAEHGRVADFLWPSTQPPGGAELSGDDLMRWSTYFNPPGLSGAG